MEPSDRTEPTENTTESTERLLSYLEHRTGHKLRSLHAVDEYMNTITPSSSGATARPNRSSLRLTAGVGVMALMFLFYYFMDVGLQISSLPSAVLTPATVVSPLDLRQQPDKQIQSRADAPTRA
jgi:tetrahydromethanopterin S-methyltransferase subunit B